MKLLWLVAMPMKQFLHNVFFLFISSKKTLQTFKNKASSEYSVDGSRHFSASVAAQHCLRHQHFSERKCYDVSSERKSSYLARSVEI